MQIAWCLNGEGVEQEAMPAFLCAMLRASTANTSMDGQALSKSDTDHVETSLQHTEIRQSEELADVVASRSGRISQTLQQHLGSTGLMHHEHAVYPRT